MDALTTLIMDWLAIHMWPMVRIGAMLMSMAAFSAQSVPVQIRLSLTLAITFAVAASVPATPKIDFLSLINVLVTLQQMLIGIALGLISQLLVQTFILAGQMIAMQTSLGFATMVDPLNGQSSPVVGQFYLLLSSMLFLSMDGHLVMIHLLAMSFETLPISVDGLTLGSIRSIVSFYGMMYQAGLLMALSASVAMLFTNFSFGVMTRAAPQLNIFSVGFAINMIFGLFILWITIGGFQAHFEAQWHRASSLMCTVIRVSC